MHHFCGRSVKTLSQQAYRSLLALSYRTFFCGSVLHNIGRGRAEQHSKDWSLKVLLVFGDTRNELNHLQDMAEHPKLHSASTKDRRRAFVLGQPDSLTWSSRNGIGQNEACLTRTTTQSRRRLDEELNMLAHSSNPTLFLAQPHWVTSQQLDMYLQPDRWGCPCPPSTVASHHGGFLDLSSSSLEVGGRPSSTQCYHYCVEHPWDVGLCSILLAARCEKSRPRHGHPVTCPSESEHHGRRTRRNVPA